MRRRIRGVGATEMRPSRSTTVACRFQVESQHDPASVDLGVRRTAYDGGSACTRANVAPSPKPSTTIAVATFDEPWAMAFLPDGRVLVTE